jgi:glycosyltransferase involved in cell wall biosynthesis
MNRLSVSVIIPAYRAAKTIGRALDSLLAQTRPADEILVVDDGSPGDFAAAVAGYREPVRLLRKPNGGAASARNYGIEKAGGNVIAFLDADDYWEPTKLERQLAVLRQHPQVGLVAGRFFEQPPGQPRTGPSPFTPAALCDRVHTCSGPEAFAVAMRMWTCTVLVRREVLGEHRFVSGLEPAEDRDLWVRLILSAPVYLLSAPLATYVLEPGSLSRVSVDRDCGNMLRVVRRHAALLGCRALRSWEAHTFGRWAGNHLARGHAAAALPFAWQRLWRQPFSPQGWWVLGKCAGRAWTCRSAPAVPTRTN